MMEIDPEQTARATAFKLWIDAPNPMVTLVKTLNVTRLVKIRKKRGLKFNMLLDYCIGKAAADMAEFYLLPVDRKLVRYDKLAVNTIVRNKTGEVSSCDIEFNENLTQFNEDYLKYTSIVANSCENRDLTDCMVIGTSAITNTEIDAAVGIYSGIFNNPFIIWGKYKKKFFKTFLTISFQFHHTQMDGAHAGIFLERLQNEINDLKV